MAPPARLLQLARQHFDPEAALRISRALDLASSAHQGQTRDDGTPYVLHPIRVAISLTEELGLIDDGLICAALLHDAVEDNADIGLQRIEADFGSRVRMVVEELTKPVATTRADVNAVYFARLRTAAEESKLVKLMDKLDNVRDSPNCPEPVKRRRTLEEAESVYLPLASGLEDPSVRSKIERLMRTAIGSAQRS
jgi:(p)ppGpp synthase/HD superfamily hydrolase